MFRDFQTDATLRATQSLAFNPNLLIILFFSKTSYPVLLKTPLYTSKEFSLILKNNI